MHEPRVTEIPNPGSLKPIKAINLTALALIVVGLYAFGHQMRYDVELGWATYIEGFFFALCFTMAGVFFIAFNYLARSVWHVPFRRIAEAMSSYLPYTLITVIPILVFAPQVYEWAQPGHAHLKGTKAQYLSHEFWAIRIVAYLLIWNFFAWRFRRMSIKQDSSKAEVRPSLFSAIYLIVFGFTFTLFSIDLLMSLRPHWFSTMYGVYCFAGSFQIGLCTLILTTLLLKHLGYFDDILKGRHLFDLGTWLLAWSTFMVYIGFSQFMLIYYANLGEETTFFIERFNGTWKYIYIAIFFIKWAMPFLILMPKPSRTNTLILGVMCTLIIIAEWLDLYWLVSPEFQKDGAFGFHFFHSFLVGLGFLGSFVYVFFNYLSKHPVVPVGDPKLLSSVNGDYL